MLGGAEQKSRAQKNNGSEAAVGGRDNNWKIRF